MLKRSAEVQISHHTERVGIHLDVCDLLEGLIVQRILNDHSEFAGQSDPQAGHKHPDECQLSQYDAKSELRRCASASAAWRRALAKTRGLSCIVPLKNINDVRR